MKTINKDHIIKALTGKNIFFPLLMASYHTGTCLCDVQHPYYGKHQLDVQQMKTADKEYKDRLHKDLIKALAQDIEMFGMDDSSYFKMLSSISQNRVRKIINNIETFS